MTEQQHHHHHHQATEDVDWGEEVAALDRGARFFREVNQAAAAWLAPGRGAVVADVGCGGGGMTVILADLVGPEGRAYAVDAEPALLAATARRAEEHGVAGRVSTVTADLGGDGLAEAIGEPLDLVWASHVVHHVPDQQAAVDRLATLPRPGGRLALAEGGLRPVTMPWDLGVGDPGLENRLRAAEEAWFADMRASMPGVVRAPYDWPVLLANAGLTEVTSRSFLLDRPAPLAAEWRSHLVASAAKRVERVGDRLGATDRAAWERLLDESGDAWLGRRDDLYALAVDSVYVGRRPA